jgi:hypothetical protein
MLLTIIMFSPSNIFFVSCTFAIFVFSLDESSIRIGSLCRRRQETHGISPRKERTTQVNSILRLLPFLYFPRKLQERLMEATTLLDRTETERLAIEESCMSAEEEV